MARGLAVRWAAAIAVASCLAASCDREPAAPSVELRAAAWQKVDDGWARTVPLDPPFLFQGSRPGDVFEAVVMPASAGTLVIESTAGAERVRVDGATRVAVPLTESGRVTVRFEGGTAALHAPRIASAKKSGSSDAPKRVLLVVVDTLRADALDRETMPELVDAFASGTRFTRAWSPASWTLPATASLFTGRHPTELALPDGTLVALALEEPTIASDFAARGYYTASISANYTINHENGFSSGSELFLAPAALDHGDWPEDEWVLDRARRVLEWFPDRDVFLYLHLMNPHDPYADRDSGVSLPAPSTGQTVAAGEVERLRAAYAAETRRTSALLAAFLREAGPFERVVVTADHGEEFQEHGGFRHGPTIYPEVGRVPLLIAGAGVEAATIDHPVSIVGLRRYLASDGSDPLAALTARDERGAGKGEERETVDLVSFVHAAPRFATVDASGQVILFARDLTPRGARVDDTVPTGAANARGARPGPTDPIGEWLYAHHPALDFVAPDGSSRPPTAEEAAAAALRLATRFHGLGAGTWLWVPPEVERLTVEVDGATGGGWWWGGAGRVEVAQDGDARAEGAAPAPARIEIESPDPFVLLFIPAMKGGRMSTLDVGDVDRAEAPPTAAPSGRAVAWRDPGRPPAELAGVEETMRRLRAQGYI